MDALERLEVRLLLEAVHEQYGYDFRDYARASVVRRIRHRVAEEGLTTISGLQERVLHDPGCLDRLLLDLSISVTSMFRDPTFYAALRAKAVPILRTYPYVRIWNAGCASGEETYSLAILLREEGLAERTRIYATDINDAVLERARAGRLPIERMQEYTRHYIASGGTAAFSDYYSAVGNEVRLDPALRAGIVFAPHNLVSDGSFNEFHLIVCRNVMIYFDRDLQARVHGLFHASLVRRGILALGHKESIRFTPHEQDYEDLDERERIYRRVG